LFVVVVELEFVVLYEPLMFPAGNHVAVNAAGETTTDPDGVVTDTAPGTVHVVPL